MAIRIKGITVEIGWDTPGLQPAINDINKLLKLDSSNTELLSQKQKLSKEAIGETTAKLEMVGDIVSSVGQELLPISFVAYRLMEIT